MRQSVVSRLRWPRWLAIAFVVAGPLGCGTILGLEDGVYDPEAGAKHDASTGDASTGGGSHDGSADSTMDSTIFEAAPSDDASDAPTTSEEAEASLCAAGLTPCTSSDGGDGGAVQCADLTSDPANCNGCGIVCPQVNDAGNGPPTCTNSTCGNGACVTGYVDCNGMASDGCEVDTLVDPNNCGMCGMACPSGDVCVNGGCSNGCPTGQTKCFHDADGGVADAGTPYCADLTGSANDCGICGNACPVNNNAPSCSGGVCGLGTCNTGFGDCNGTATDGCETNTQTNPAHCGTCTNDCAEMNATAQCTGGSCAIGTCDTGFADCNNNPVDGCEKNLTNDPANCGNCGTPCSTQCTIDVTGTTCSGSQCVITTCTPTYYDVDSTCSDGCECKASLPTTCAAPTLVTLSGPGTSENVTGNLVPLGTSTWIQVAFTGNTSSSFHPHVAFMTNPNAEYVFDIETNCTGTGIGGCVDITGGASTALTNWEKFYMTGVDFVDAHFEAIPAVGTIFIHVYRATGAPVDCNSYTLTVSN